MHCSTSAQEFLLYQSPAEGRASGRSSLLELHCFCTNILLRDVSLGQSHRKLPDAGDHSYTFRHRDRSARIEQIKKMRALQAQLVSGEKRETLFRIDGSILVSQKSIE